MPIESERTDKPFTVGSGAVGKRGGWPRSDPSASGSSTSKTAQQESALESHHEHTIEKAFSKLKAMLRKAEERTVRGLWDLIGKLVDIFQPKECANYFSSCGYDSE
ncbi:hypothetical protein SAMN05518866_1561 [Sphingobium sp. YR768]|nr:hypothetical protein SAMN05518866_1561 [Sphingobium sp. YR768]